MSDERRLSKPCAGMLSGIDIFTDLTSKQRQKLVPLCHLSHCQAGKEIISYRATGEDVYFIVSGKVQVIVFSMTGRQVVLSDLSAGELFGELAAIDHKPRAAFVIAATDATICSMSSDNFRQTLQRYPVVNEAMLKKLTGRVRQLCERVIEISTLPIRHRVHVEILRHALQHRLVNNTVMIDPAPTHMDIANRIGTHREAVSREMIQLRNLGIIKRVYNNTLTVTDMQQLQNLARELSEIPRPWLRAC